MFVRITERWTQQASAGMAWGLLSTGALLMGLAALVWVLREVFALLAAMLFFLLGVVCVVVALKLLWRVFRTNRSDASLRRGVRLHSEVDDWF